MEDMTPREDATLAPDIDGLRIANDFMAQEGVTGEPIREKFGGAYEVLYCGPKGFERVDEVMHVFALARVLQTDIEILHYPHVTRQWYESDQLVIASFSTPHAHQQGLEFMAFAIPSVLGQKAPTARTIASLASRPNYMCIHHLFEIEGEHVPSTMVLRGDAIDQMFKLSQVGDRLVFEATDDYRARVQMQAAGMSKSVTRGN